MINGLKSRLSCFLIIKRRNSSDSRTIQIIQRQIDQISEIMNEAKCYAVAKHSLVINELILFVTGNNPEANVN